MHPSTLQIISATLKADITIDPDSRKRILALLRTGGESRPTNTAKSASPPSIIRRAEAARRLAHSVRTVDYYIARGLLKVVRLRGQKRGIGIDANSLDELIAGK